MSDLLKEYQLRLEHDHKSTETYGRGFVLTLRELTKTTISERISAFQEADQVCLDAMREYAKQQDPPLTPEEALENWEKTVWHKLIAGKIFKLKELLKELEV